MEDDPGGAHPEIITIEDQSAWPIPEKTETLRLHELASRNTALYTEYVKGRRLPDEELVILTAQLEKGRQAAEILASDPESIVANAATIIRAEQAKWKIVLYNLGYARHLAFKSMPRTVRGPSAPEYYFNNLPLEDRIQTANIGLIRAVERYRSDDQSEAPPAARFRAYIKKRIQGDIKEALYKESELPQYLVMDIGAVRMVEGYLTQRLGRRPLRPEIMAELRWDEKKMTQVEKAGVFIKRVSLTDTDERQGPVIVAHLESRHASSVEERDFITRIMQHLENPRQKLVITLLYGLLGDEPMTLEEVAEFLGQNISLQRVDQIRIQALENIRKILYRQSGVAQSPQAFKDLKEQVLYES